MQQMKREMHVFWRLDSNVNALRLESSSIYVLIFDVAISITLHYYVGQWHQSPTVRCLSSVVNILWRLTRLSHWPVAPQVDNTGEYVAVARPVRWYANHIQYVCVLHIRLFILIADTLITWNYRSGGDNSTSRRIIRREWRYICILTKLAIKIYLKCKPLTIWKLKI